MNQTLKNIKKNLISGRVDSEDEGFDEDLTGQPGVIELVQQALEEKIPPSDILTHAVTPGMEEVGQLFEKGEYLVPDMLASAQCVAEATKILKPYLAESDINVIGSIHQDPEIFESCLEGRPIQGSIAARDVDNILDFLFP